MPYLTLTLNGYPVDLPADAEVALSYRANDLRNLDSREAAFSETFTLPLTAQVAQVLGTPHALDSGTTTPYRLLPAVLTSPGGTVLLNGFGIIESTGVGYDVTLTDALGGLFAQVGSKKLRDLNLSAYDHAYTFANVAAAQGFNHDHGYTYALADDGRLTHRDVAKGALFYELRLIVYYHTLLKAIVAEALPGFRPAGSLLLESSYRRAALAQPTAYPQLSEAQRKNSSASGRLVATHLYPGSATYNDAKYVGVQFPTNVQDPGGNFFAGIYFKTPPFRCDLTIQIQGRALLSRLPDGPAGPAAGIALLTLRDSNQPGGNTAPVGEQGVYNVFKLFADVLTSLPTQPITFNYSVTIPACEPGQLLFLELAYVTLQVKLFAGASISFEVGPRVYPKSPIGLSGNLPDLTQADFLKLVCNQYDLIVQADQVFRQIRFDLFNDLERNRPRARDWTQKLDLTSKPRLSFRLGDYAQRNTLAYDEAPKAYEVLGVSDAVATGSSSLVVTNATLPAQAEAYAAPVVLPLPHPALAETTTLLWLPFVAEPDAFNSPVEPWDQKKTYGDTEQVVVYDSVLWKGRALVAGTVPGSSRSSSDGTWQVVEYEQQNETLKLCVLLESIIIPSLLVRDDAPSTATFIPTQGLSRVGFTFGELLPAYYPGLSRILERVQQLVVDVRLTALDIEQLDYTIPVRLGPLDIPGYGRLACIGYLNDIDQYLPGSPGAVACTLLVFGTPVAGLAPPVPMPGGILYRVLAEEDSDYLLTEAGSYILLEY